jgi:hypothetical protein
MSFPFSLKAVAYAVELNEIFTMTLEQIRTILHGTDPFLIRMVSGREYRVEHPDFAGLGRDFATLHFTDDQGRLELIRLSQVESVNVLKEPAA